MSLIELLLQCLHMQQQPGLACQNVWTIRCHSNGRVNCPVVTCDTGETETQAKYAAVLQHNTLVWLTCSGTCHKPGKELATRSDAPFGASLCNLHRQRESATILRLSDQGQLERRAQDRLHTWLNMVWVGERSSQYLKSLYLTVPRRSARMPSSAMACRNMRKALGICCLRGSFTLGEGGNWGLLASTGGLLLH